MKQANYKAIRNPVPAANNGVCLQYKSILLSDCISIQRIISVHYFQYLSDFTFPGERHDFWELVAVDRGVIDAVEDDRKITMHGGNFLLHRPGVFHNILTNGKISPSLIVIAFECRSHYLEELAGQLLSIDDSEKELLAQIIVEAKSLFEGPLDRTYQEKLEFQNETVFGSAQILHTSLEQMLIMLYRQKIREFAADRAKPFRDTVSNAEMNRHITAYLNAHVWESLKIEDICRDNLISRTHLQRLSREIYGCGIMKYFINLKIEKAKELIRNKQYDFTRIAYELGYSSLFYFSRQFKQITSMSPSEYVSSVRSIAEKADDFHQERSRR